MGGGVLESRPVRTPDLSGHLFCGIGPEPRPGVLVIHGGGGAGGYERTYAARIAEHGYTVLCADYFDAPGIPDALVEIPLSYFADAADWLLSRHDVAGDRVGVVGFSRGGEAALLVSAEYDTVGVVVAYVPSCYVFPAPSWMEGVEAGRAAWTLGGDPLPFIPVDTYAADVDVPLGAGPPSPATVAIEQSTTGEREAAAIPVERIEGPVLLVSGGEDTLWPSTELSSRAIGRLERHDHPWPFEHASYPDAGHAIRVPYRFGANDSPDEAHRFGGTNRTNAHASADAWYRALRFLRLGL